MFTGSCGDGLFRLKNENQPMEELLAAERSSSSALGPGLASIEGGVMAPTSTVTSCSRSTIVHRPLARSPRTTGRAGAAIRIAEPPDQSALALPHDPVMIPSEQPFQQWCHQVHPKPHRPYGPVETDQGPFSVRRAYHASLTDEVSSSAVTALPRRIKESAVEPVVDVVRQHPADHVFAGGADPDDASSQDSASLVAGGALGETRRVIEDVPDPLLRGIDPPLCQEAILRHDRSPGAFAATLLNDSPWMSSCRSVLRNVSGPRSRELSLTPFLRRTIRISCRGRLQDLHAARNQDGGPGQLHPFVMRRSLCRNRILPVLLAGIEPA